MGEDEIGGKKVGGQERIRSGGPPLQALGGQVCFYNWAGFMTSSSSF